MNISQYNTFWMKNVFNIVLCKFQTDYPLFKKNPFAQSIFILPVLKTITNLVKYPKLTETHIFQRQIFSLLICSFLSE